MSTLAGIRTVVVCALVAVSTASTAGGARLLFSEWNDNAQNSIVRRDLTTGEQVTLLAGSGGNVGPQPHHFGPIGMVADTANQRLYFADVNGGAVSRINYDGSGWTPVVSGSFGIEDVAVDFVGGKVYWTDTFNDRIQRADLNGQNVQTIVNTGLLQASGIALDMAHGRLYWADYHTDVIGSCDLDGSNRTQFATPGGGPIDIAVDTVNGKLIWTDFDSYKVHRSDLNGANKTILVNGVSGTNLPGQITLDPVNGYMYWIDWDLNTIRRANLDGSNIVPIYSSPGISSLSGIAWDPIPEPGGAVTLLIAGVVSGMAGRRRRFA
jgi:DNA-binding beta-propeller fold protein YncE